MDVRSVATWLAVQQAAGCKEDIIDDFRFSAEVEKVYICLPFGAKQFVFFMSGSMSRCYRMCIMEVFGSKNIIH